MPTRGWGVVLMTAFALGATSSPFRDGRQTLRIELEPAPVVGLKSGAAVPGQAAFPEWQLARLNGGEQQVLVGRQLIVSVAQGEVSPAHISGVPVSLVRRLAPGTWLAEASTPALALAAAAELSGRPGIVAAFPNYRRLSARLAGWVPVPNDPYFSRQIYLDTPRPETGPALPAADLNIRSAWATTRGAGITVAICDDGLDSRHPELAPNLVPELHRNFFTQATNANHSGREQYHGTAVSGLAGARGDNGRGMSGTAPDVSLCGWVLFDQSNNLVPVEALAELFEFANDRVAVQNHSWGNADFEPLIISALERNALSNSVVHGRGGRGVVHVRAAGNTRQSNFRGRSGVGDVNLDAFGNHPEAITVAAVRTDGRVASYSAPGACVLVAALGGERSDRSAPFTLDPVGDAGRQTIASAGVELADYLFTGLHEPGTSFTTPQISGLAALLLAARPDLTARDVALVLALSARPVAVDPVTQTNGAGLLTGDNVGFGVPDAGRAVGLARRLGALTNAWAAVRSLKTNVVEIPDDGFRVQLVVGDRVEVDAGATGGTSALLDTRMGRAQLGTLWPVTAVDAGVGGFGGSTNLVGRVALLDRRPQTFEDNLNQAAAAGAVAGVIIDDLANAPRVLMLRNEFARIPGAFVTQADGAALRSWATNAGARMRFVRRPARIEFEITEPLALRTAEVRLRWEHPRQGDLRVTLISPAGTVSLLQRPGTALAAVLEDWSFTSKQILLESPVGRWVLEITDESPDSIGRVSEAELILTGRALGDDADRDGLADDWERHWFGDRPVEPAADPDGDGLSNAAEQALGTNPLQPDVDPVELAVDAPNRFRLRWPALSGRRYQVEFSEKLGLPFQAFGSALGQAPEGSWFVPADASARFYRVRPME